MNITAWNTKRRMVPRWRSLDLTAKSGELTSIQRPNAGVTTWAVSPELQLRLERWRKKPTLLSAAELVESAIVEGKEAAAVSAARHLVFMARHAAPLVKRQAVRVLQRAGYVDGLPEEEVGPDISPVAFWRRRTRSHPHDALAWVELSLRHTNNGHLEHARKAMDVAMLLAPDNRHVLRSAARLHLHRQDPERAHDLIARSPATKGDPWLLAAEISLAELAEKVSRFSKSGLRLVDDGGLAPHLTTELSGALATLELINGRQSRARKMFKQSLAAPTGNSLAQAEWATAALGSELVPQAQFGTVQEAGEANAFHYFSEEQYLEVAPACERWSAEEPYSIRPFEFGAAVTGLIGDYAKAEEIAGRGLRMRPGTPKLINSLAFAQASSDRLDEAEATLATLNRQSADESSLNIYTANRGLIAFRRGHEAEAVALYQTAIAGFRRDGERLPEATAKIYLAREATIAGSPEASALVGLAVAAWTKVSPGRSHPVLVAIEQQQREQSAPPKSPGPGDEPNFAGPGPAPGRQITFRLTIEK
jgi:tetratricopeptide (TPR) repeat protein